MIYNAADYGIAPEKHIGKELSSLVEMISQTDEEKTLVFDGGTYYIDSEDCGFEMLYVTNTAGDGEYKKGETPHRAKVAFNLKNIKNLKIEGNGAKFIIDGMVTNAAIQNCENIEINDIEITAKSPDLHELKVLEIGKHYVDFEVGKGSGYEFRHGKLVFYGTDYEVFPMKKYKKAGYLGRVKESDTNTIERVGHLFGGAIKAKDLGDGKIRIYYFKTKAFENGDRYYCFNNRRQNVGIFVNESKNISLDNVAQHFNYALAFVAQNTENISLNRLDFTPDKESGRLMTSIADFLQICMCRGTVNIENSAFEGACDDCLNVHGVHFKITSVKENNITVKFMHPQSHGYNPFRAGDEIAFINPKTLLESGTATVISSKLLSEYKIELKLDSAKKATVGEVIENTSACPEVSFKNNTISRIATRGILITNRGKTVVENNRFISNSMSGVLLSDDAEGWFESGMCRDVTIKGNVFEHCGEDAVRILPENKVHEGFVHSGIKILDNDFKSYNGTCITAKSTEYLVITGNSFADDNRLELINCDNIVKDF